MSFLGRLRSSLQRTKDQIVGRFEQLVTHADAPAERARPVDSDTLDSLEELLIGADVGVAATGHVVERVRARSRHGESLRDLVKGEILRILESVPAPAPLAVAPHVVLVVGVNGTGKTTTVGKIAHLLRLEGRSVVIGAADTFRAAAVEQLDVWAQRAGVPLVRTASGADPAAVVFDALAAAKARRHDVVLIDTAGRLHTRVNLMHELEKIRRVAAREVPGAPHDVWLVLDATVGQNGIAQARQFTEVAGVTGVVLTKLDGTAKGGIAVAIAHDLALPIRYVGTGEAIDDLVPFAPREYVDALFEAAW